MYTYLLSQSQYPRRLNNSVKHQLQKRKQLPLLLLLRPSTDQVIHKKKQNPKKVGKLVRVLVERKKAGERVSGMLPSASVMFGAFVLIVMLLALLGVTIVYKNVLKPRLVREHLKKE
jgi:hypothetical protein